MKKNLIFIYQFCNTNHVSIEFLPTVFHVKDLSKGAILLTGKTKDGVYEWPISSPKLSSPLLVFSNIKTTSSECHSRVGHQSSPILQHIMSIFSLPYSMSQNSLCNVCLSNKSHKLPFSTSIIVSSHPLEIILSNVWTSPIYSIDNFKYYIIFVDHFTRYIWYYPLKKKSHVYDVFLRFKALVENHFKNSIVTLYSDNGGEYQALDHFLSLHRISHLTSPSHIPKKKGLSEREHRHIVETSLSLLTHASLPLTCWNYAFVIVVYLINRMPTPIFSLSSPYGSFFHFPPNYTKLRIFGCLCYPWLRPYSSHKLESRSLPCVFVGYSLTQSAYLCLDPSTSKIYTCRNVNFVESVFPFKLILVIQVQKHYPIGFHLRHFFPLWLRHSIRLQQPRPRARIHLTANLRSTVPHPQSIVHHPKLHVP